MSVNIRRKEIGTIRYGLLNYFEIRKSVKVTIDLKSQLKALALESKKDVLLKLLKDISTDNRNCRAQPDIVERIATLLLEIPGFQNFVEYNNIEVGFIIKAIRSIEYVEYEQGDIIFFQGEISDCFYGVVEGIVDMVLHYIKSSVNVDESTMKKLKQYHTNRASKKSSLACISKWQVFTSDKKLALEEAYPSIFYDTRTLVQFSEGQCFGDWGLIYKMSRTTTAYAATKVKLFRINEKCFKENFYHCVFKADIERREYVKQRISYFKDIDKATFKKIYLNISPMHAIVKQEIHRENDGGNANFIYLIYKGGVEVLKSIYHKGDHINHPILKLYEGSLIGWEIVLKFHEDMINKKRKDAVPQSTYCYDYTVRVVTKKAILLKINFNAYDKEMKKGIANCLFEEINKNKEYCQTQIQRLLSKEEETKLYYYTDNLKDKCKSPKSVIKKSVQIQEEKTMKLLRDSSKRKVLESLNRTNIFLKTEIMDFTTAHQGKLSSRQNIAEIIHKPRHCRLNSLMNIQLTRIEDLENNRQSIYDNLIPFSLCSNNLEINQIETERKADDYFTPATSYPKQKSRFPHNNSDIKSKQSSNVKKNSVLCVEKKSSPELENKGLSSYLSSISLSKLSNKDKIISILSNNHSERNMIMSSPSKFYLDDDKPKNEEPKHKSSICTLITLQGYQGSIKSRVFKSKCIKSGEFELPLVTDIRSYN